MRRTAILTLSLALQSTSAVAANWDKPTGLDAWIDYNLCDLNSGWHDAWHSNNDHDIAPTAIIPTHFHGCSTVEVRVTDPFYGSSQPVGFWHCHDGSSSWCLTGHVHINLDKVGTYTAAQKLSLMCQEVGHSVGLKHPTSGTSCMIQAVSASRQHLIQHDTDILDAQYA